jgi:hypothetical protein
MMSATPPHVGTSRAGNPPSDGFPSFAEFAAHDPKLARAPPSEFDFQTQANGPDSQPMHLARLYTVGIPFPRTTARITRARTPCA